AGAHAQATIVYTVSPVHTVEGFIELGVELAKLDADSICIKDMAGLLKPLDAKKLVAGLKEAVSIPIQLDCHYTSGLASMSYLAAIEAGVDVIDTALSPLALGTSQPPTETLVAALKDTGYDTKIDLQSLTKA